jgi:hypothetical protein
MSNKKEIAVIDFTKFDIQQLPELQGKKEEIKKVIKENPVVKVTDNASYELAKKSRTAVKTLRTSLEKEKKEVNDRIKKNVLEVVANEYDSLIADVRNNENARQEEASAWEEKKEQERLEKLRLEQERVDGIKKSIRDFRENNEKFIASCVFESIDATKEVFEKGVSEFDRESLAEFEVLFDDAVAYLDHLLETRIATLTEQENMRLEQIRLAEEREKQEAESKRIAEEMRIEREKYLAEQKRVAEEQRIAQENFLREKREFEEKQAEAKFQERKKFLVDEDYWRIYLLAECAEEEDVAKGKLLNYTESEFEDFKLAVLKAKEPVVESNESAKESVVVFEIDGDNLTAHEEYHEADVDPKGVIPKDNGLEKRYGIEYGTKGNEPETPIVFDALTEETWGDIFTEWNFKTIKDKSVDTSDFMSWLEENYNVPTRKQQ